MEIVKVSLSRNTSLNQSEEIWWENVPKAGYKTTVNAAEPQAHKKP